MREDCGGDPTRREFLRWSVAGTLSLALAQRALFAQEGERPPGGGAAEAVIVLDMAGGMSQTDTFDPKPGTASAGPLRAIKTRARGLELSELLPRLADRADRLAVIRSMATREGAHDRAQYLLHTGYAPSGTVHHPDLGALVAQAKHDAALDVPAYVCVGGGAPVGAGFLGVAHSPFVVGDPSRPVENLGYPQGVDAARFDRRRRLLEAIERKFRKDHPGAETDGHTAVYERADRLMHSPRAAAFDLSQEPAGTRAAYGESGFGQGCLLARRLVEVGVKAVEVRLGGWDTHQDNFTQNRRLAGQLDAGFAALLGDLAERGLLEKTLVVLLTEFGRTPGINKDDGRDHFANGWSAVLAGGGVRGGQAIGATSADGREIAARPVTAQDLMASLFHALGCDATRVNQTRAGRPIRAVDAAGKVVRELFA